MKRFILPGVLALAFLLRVVGLSNFPVGFTPDEASFGYDAYSILKTGNDQWGKPFPLVLESFGDYKSPLYAYLVIPSVAVFGLSKFAVRFPNALIGTLAVLATYLLAGEMASLAGLKERKKKWLQLMASGLLAISSWHIMMSRGAFEANLVTFFIPFGIYLFLRGLKNGEFFIFSSFIFGLSLFTYHSAKVIAPVVFVSLIWIFRKKFFGSREWALSLALFSIFLGGLLYTLTIGGGARASERSITQGALEEGARQKIELIQKGVNPIVAKALHNKYQVIVVRFLTNYSQYFSFRFLFTKGPAETTYGMIPGLGVLYPFEGILLLGVVPLFLQKRYRNVLITILLWLLVSPIPAALATGVGYSANRAEGMIPTVQILEVFGAVGWRTWLDKLNKKVLMLVTFVFAILVAGEIVKYSKVYFVDSPKIMAKGMLYGNLEAASWLKENKDEKEVVVSTNLSEPHIYIAFANSWEPKDYQKQTRQWGFKENEVSWVDQMSSYTLGDYIFQKVDWKKNTGKPNTLLVGRADEFPPDTKSFYTIYYPDGSPGIFVVQ